MRSRPKSLVLQVLSILNLIALLGLAWLETALAEHFWLVTVIAYAPQYPFGIASLGLFGWALFVRNARAVAVNLMALGLVAFFFLGWNLPWRALTQKPAGTPLRVVTYNIRNSADALEAVRKLKPDVICAQESSALNDPHLGSASLISGYASVTEDELTVISRYPIRSHRLIRLPPVEPVSALQPTNQSFLEALIEVRRKPVRVIDVHVWTPDILGRLPRYASLGLKDRVTQFSLNRWVEVGRVLSEAAAGSVPVIVCGDFNTPPRGALYGALKTKLTDAFAASGWGLGDTYSARWPLLRIDYVWTSDRLRAVGSFVAGEQGSDHRALIADLLLER